MQAMGWLPLRINLLNFHVGLHSSAFSKRTPVILCCYVKSRVFFVLPNAVFPVYMYVWVP